ncbi:MAG: biopolymer transporter ExbD [Bacteroidaceae bacterium]|nr:biopolymer transporter ExbD [Bacteroidaceae bacterium]
MITKQKKKVVRVDFTPMVDMMMLLITFFMLCTSLIKPKTMEISMPSNKDDLNEEQQNKVKASEAITLLFDKDNKIYYYEGIPEINTLKETSYDDNGLRQFLLKRNINAIQKVKKLREKYEASLTGDAFQEKQAKSKFDKEVEKIRGEKGVPNVIIKGVDEGTYENLIRCLDEMQICDIGKYVIVPIDDFDKDMIAYYKEHGNAAPAE